jgi:hypothetical protein
MCNCVTGARTTLHIQTTNTRKVFIYLHNSFFIINFAKLI